MYPNRTIARCPACKDELKLRPHRRWKVVEFGLWAIFINLVIPPRLGGLFPLVLAFFICIPFIWASRRLYHSYWMWRHPQRCQGGGLPEPKPSTTT